MPASAATTPPHDADQDADIGQEPAAIPGDQQHHDQHEGRNGDVRGLGIGGVVHGRGQFQPVRHRRGIGGGGLQPRRMRRVHHLGCGGAALNAEDPVYADAHQRHADDEDDGARHHRRKEAQHPRHQWRQKDGDEACGDDRAEDHACAVDAGVGRTDGHHRADRREGNAHHHRHLDAEPACRAKRLDKRDDAADEQVRRDQKGHLRRRQLQGAADDKRHGHRAGIHDQHVLQAQREELGGRQHLVYGMNARLRARGIGANGIGGHQERSSLFVLIMMRHAAHLGHAPVLLLSGAGPITASLLWVPLAHFRQSV